ncbi:hypothetical protein O6H91_03G071000 [Diphasiastrum complanatum]|uniref:Uncharacterized protein n=1 Tax=Diphasiastrum complanatum TaxID=34168 RepID=A0ACC2E894_DIPCM|nr:hypothetical protein O6H91_03G071000 [Diphasiastrum complanatum]
MHLNKTTDSSTTIVNNGLASLASIQRSFKLDAYLQSRKLLSSSGKATYYDNYSVTRCYDTSHCKFLSGDRSVAVKSDMFEMSKCGQCLLVTCTCGTQNDGNCCNQDHPSVVVKIVDECDGSCDGDLDLSLQAFQYIAKKEEGIIQITCKR